MINDSIEVIKYIRKHNPNIYDHGISYISLAYDYNNNKRRDRLCSDKSYRQAYSKAVDFIWNLEDKANSLLANAVFDNNFSNITAKNHIVDNSNHEIWITKHENGQYDYSLSNFKTNDRDIIIDALISYYLN